MSINGVVEGGTGDFEAVTIPAGSVLPPGVVPQWTSSDVTIATVSQSADPTGMTCVLTGVANGSITLTVSATLPDGTVAQGSVSIPISAGEVKGFSISQTS